MGRLGIVCVEVERPSGPLRKWDDALRAQIGAFREQEAVRCLPMDGRPFKGRIEHGALGEMLLCKVAATHYRVTRSSTTPAPTLLTGTMLVSVSKGYCKFVQRGRTCILGPRDWALIELEAVAGVRDLKPRDRSVRDHPAASIRSHGCRPLRVWRHTSIERQVGIVASPARHGERELRRDAPSSRVQRKKTGRSHRHDGLGRLARTDRGAADDRLPRRTIDAGQDLY